MRRSNDCVRLLRALFEHWSLHLRLPKSGRFTATASRSWQTWLDRKPSTMLSLLVALTLFTSALAQYTCADGSVRYDVCHFAFMCQVSAWPSVYSAAELISVGMGSMDLLLLGLSVLWFVFCESSHLQNMMRKLTYCKESYVSRLNSQECRYWRGWTGCIYRCEVQAAKNGFTSECASTETRRSSSSAKCTLWSFIFSIVSLASIRNEW